MTAEQVCVRSLASNVCVTLSTFAAKRRRPQNGAPCYDIIMIQQNSMIQ